HYVPHCEVEHFVQIERLARDRGNLVQYLQFMVAATYLLFGAARLGNVNEKALICGAAAGRVAGNEAGLESSQYLAIFAADVYLVVLNEAARGHGVLECLLVLDIGSRNLPHIDLHELGSGAVAEHFDQGVIAVEDAPVSGGDEHAFANAVEQAPIALFGGGLLSNIANDVNGSGRS